MFNPSILLKMKSAKDKFCAEHPKFVKFLGDAYKSGICENTVLDVKMTTPDGKEMHSNIRVTQSDVELFKALSELAK